MEEARPKSGRIVWGALNQFAPWPADLGVIIAILNAIASGFLTRNFEHASIPNRLTINVRRAERCRTIGQNYSTAIRHANCPSMPPQLAT
jgi:hypothetical protein